MLRPGGVACPAPARTFTTELSWAGSPRKPKSAITGWFIVIYHRRTFTGWTGSLMGCELIFANELATGNPSGSGSATAGDRLGGVRPSSGAAMSERERAPMESDASEQPVLAAPEDRRTPITL